MSGCSIIVHGKISKPASEVNYPQYAWTRTLHVLFFTRHFVNQYLFFVVLSNQRLCSMQSLRLGCQEGDIDFNNIKLVLQRGWFNQKGRNPLQYREKNISIEATWSCVFN